MYAYWLWIKLTYQIGDSSSTDLKAVSKLYWLELYVFWSHYSRVTIYKVIIAIPSVPSNSRLIQIYRDIKGIRKGSKSKVLVKQVLGSERDGVVDSNSRLYPFRVTRLALQPANPCIFVTIYFYSSPLYSNHVEWLNKVTQHVTVFMLRFFSPLGDAAVLWIKN